ncbi:MAG: TatD family hydrolase [Opitutaceae bacterium]|nr:TatD family hydrolase [Opitutaceae bacterium]
MRLFEAHVHYQDHRLVPHWPVLAAELPRAGIAEAVCNGTSAGDWNSVADLSSRHPWIRPAFGLHPWHVGNAQTGWLDELRRLLLADQRAVVGEIGLDLWMLNAARSDDPRLAGLSRASLEVQESAFAAQLELAAELQRPPTIHCLNAWERLEQVLKRARLPSSGFLLHGFAGPYTKVANLMDAGAYFSFNGYFLSPRHTDVREVFRRLPVDRILVETDAPSMPLPDSHRIHNLPASAGNQAPAHPANLVIAYAALAELRGIPVEDLAGAVERNFSRLFAGVRQRSL